MCVSSYLGSKLFPTRATLDGSFGDSGVVLLSESSIWMDVLEVLVSSIQVGLSQGLLQLLHLQDQVGIVRNCHELGKCRPSEERVVCHLEVGYLKLHVLSTEVFPSLEGHEKSDLANGGCCCVGDYSVERSPTRTQCKSRQPRLLEYLPEHNVQGAAFINKDSVKLDILDNGAGNQRVPTQLCYKVRVVTAVKGDGDLGPL
jgi:hypothetical protein